MSLKLLHPTICKPKTYNWNTVLVVGLDIFGRLNAASTNAICRLSLNSFRSTGRRF